MTSDVTLQESYLETQRRMALLRQMNAQYTGKAKKAKPSESQPSLGFLQQQPGGQPFSKLPEIDLVLSPSAERLQEKFDLATSLFDRGQNPFEINPSQNAVLNRLLKLVEPALNRGTPLTGFDASSTIDTKQLALNRGVQVQDLSKSLPQQPAVLSPQLLELVWMLWRSNGAFTQNTSSNQQHFQNFLNDVSQNLGQFFDPTAKSGGGGGGLYFGFSGGTGSQQGEGQGSFGQQRSFKMLA